MNNYEVMSIIGEGAYGIVLKAKHKQTRKKVAIKKFKEAASEQLLYKTINREIQVLKALKHPNIVDLHEAFRKDNRVFLVFEYVDNNMLEVL